MSDVEMDSPTSADVLMHVRPLAEFTRQRAPSRDISDDRPGWGSWVQTSSSLSPAVNQVAIDGVIDAENSYERG